jgi:hypothetical protein
MIHYSLPDFPRDHVAKQHIERWIEVGRRAQGDTLPKIIGAISSQRQWFGNLSIQSNVSDRQYVVEQILYAFALNILHLPSPIWMI